MRKRTVAFIVGLFGLLAIEAHAAPSVPKHPAAAKWDAFIKGRSGCFLVYDVRAKRLVVERGGKACDRRAAPCSTFKIVNALIGLETGVVNGPEQKYKWDGRKRYFKSWNQDQTLRSAIARSAVWVFQIIARKVGKTRMQRYLDQLSYGNRDISGPLDRFWIESSLKVSPREQLALIKRLFAATPKPLPFRPKTVAQVREILFWKKVGDTAISGKTGTGLHPKTEKVDIGWYVAELKSPTRHWLVVAQLRGPGSVWGNKLRDFVATL